MAKDRLPVFGKVALKELTCAALAEARLSAGFLVLAYVVMPDHLHTIVASELKPSRVQQYINGIASRRIIDFFKVNGYELSLKKLQHDDRGRNYRYSLWDHHPHTKPLTSEDVLMQKVNYVHQNPVRADLEVRADEYRWSSARIWRGKPLEDEPLTVDVDQIAWRSRK